MPFQARRISIVANGETDLSLMGGCLPPHKPKARHLSPIALDCLLGIEVLLQMYDRICSAQERRGGIVL